MRYSPPPTITSKFPHDALGPLTLTIPCPPGTLCVGLQIGKVESERAQSEPSLMFFGLFPRVALCSDLQPENTYYRWALERNGLFSN